MAEKCPCQTDCQSCCACVSMHCDECHKPDRSKFVQGRFCSNCGRPLKAELIRVYVPKSEVEKIFEGLAKSVYSKIPMKIRPIFKDDRDFDAGVIDGKRDALIEVLSLIAELKKKYTEGTE